MKPSLRTFAVLGLTAASLTFGGAALATNETSDPGTPPAQTTTPEIPHGGKILYAGKFDASALVKSGVIDQETADKIAAWFDAKAADRQTEMDKVRDMTEEERQTYFEAKKDDAPLDIWSELVTAGILTQEQADAIHAALPATIRIARGELPEGAETHAFGGGIHIRAGAFIPPDDVAPSQDAVQPVAPVLADDSVEL